MDGGGGRLGDRIADGQLRWNKWVEVPGQRLRRASIAVGREPAYRNSS